MSAPTRFSGFGPGLSAVLVIVLAMVLGGCATTVETTTTSTGAAPSRDVRAEADPGDLERRARVRLELASAYFSRGQTATALEELKLALAAKPDLPEAFNLRGLIYANMGEAKLAEESFLRALQFNPRDFDAMHNFGWFLCQQRRYDDADAQFRQALAQPQYGGATRTLLAQGVCQARSGKLPEAERTLSRSYELDPANPVTAYNLSEVLLRRGELERARFYVRRINSNAEQVNAQSLWLAARIEQRMGNAEDAQQLGRQLRDRFPQSPEALQFGRGRFDDQ
jgi:type IV pilus assembly protein PilF